MRTKRVIFADSDRGVLVRILTCLQSSQNTEDTSALVALIPPVLAPHPGPQWLTTLCWKIPWVERSWERVICDFGKWDTTE